MKKVIAVCGPTAVGKTRMGVSLAEALHGEVISGDSMQIYRTMDIGTAKVTEEEIQEAYSGDIIGVFDPGIFSIGDTICTPKHKFKFEGIPTFAPEHFARIRNTDTMKRKQFVKGVEQIAQEGAIKIFTEIGGSMEEIIVGVVGVLQFEVLEYRLKNEYNVNIKREPLGYQFIRWIDNEEIDLYSLNLSSDTKRVQDLRGKYLLLFSNQWGINWATDKNKELILSEFSKN